MRYDFHPEAFAEYQQAVNWSDQSSIAEVYAIKSSSFDEIIRVLAFDLVVQRGLKDSDDDRTIANQEMHRRTKN